MTLAGDMFGTDSEGNDIMGIPHDAPVPPHVWPTYGGLQRGGIEPPKPKWSRVKQFKYRFWMWIHNRLEKVWHWVYYQHMIPNRKPDTLPGATYLTAVGVYRENGDGTYTKIDGELDLGEGEQMQ